MPNPNSRKKPILITNGSGPASLEWSRICAKAGYPVLIANCGRWSLCATSRSVAKHYSVPSPRHEPRAFTLALQEIIAREGVGLVLPVYEEIFPIAQARSALSTLCPVFCSNFDLLRCMHSKYEFATYARSHGLAVPETELLDSVPALESVLTANRSVVLKPEFSRFSSKTVILPSTREQVRHVRPDPSARWVVQDYIPGHQICTFSLAREGKILAHAAYATEFTVGKGASIAWQAIHHPEALKWVGRFLQLTGFTGQVGFDFIEGAQLFAIECNPRATSGIHLLADQPGLLRAIIADHASCLIPPTGKKAMHGLLMADYVLRRVRSPFALHHFWQTVSASRDVIFSHSDPLPFLCQGLGLLDLARIAHTHDVSLTEAATFNFEWNGQLDTQEGDHVEC